MILLSSLSLSSPSCFQIHTHTHLPIISKRLIHPLLRYNRLRAIAVVDSLHWLLYLFSHTCTILSLSFFLVFNFFSLSLFFTVGSRAVIAGEGRRKKEEKGKSSASATVVGKHTHQSANYTALQRETKRLQKKEKRGTFRGNKIFHLFHFFFASWCHHS